MCISLSGGRSIPTEEFVSPSKFLVNSWPKSKFSWWKQLPVSNIQEKISLERRDQIKAITQNEVLHYSMSAKVFQKLNITVMLASKSLSNWQGAHSCIPWAPLTFWYFYHTAISTDTMLSSCTLDGGFHKYCKKCYSFHERPHNENSSLYVLIRFYLWDICDWCRRQLPSLSRCGSHWFQRGFRLAI